MYCSNCGTKAGGNFCSACGAKIQAPGELEELPLEPPRDWTEEIDYETLMQHPEVRDRIAKAAQKSPKRISGEDLLAVYDAIQPTGVPLQKLTVALLPVFDRMGFKTGKQSQLTLRAPAGRTLVAILCGMAGQGFEIQKVDQLDDGCVLTALVPSTIWTNRGEMVVGVERRQDVIQIQAAIKISGQLMDWGKSAQTLRQFFDEVRREVSPKEPPALPPRNVA